jgi:hypothetical protein
VSKVTKESQENKEQREFQEIRVMMEKRVIKVKLASEGHTAPMENLAKMVARDQLGIKDHKDQEVSELP